MPKKPLKTKEWIVGVDEVGRGPLAGPVTVCVTAMARSVYDEMLWVYEGALLRDSKKMSSVHRERWATYAKTLKRDKKLLYAVVSKQAGTIDKKGISGCITSCISVGLQKLGLDPDAVSVVLDGGLRAPEMYKDQQTVIRGDDSHKIISLASVVAKVSRDAFLVSLDKKHPEYGWAENKGYGTLAHRQALKKYGLTRYHRKTFIS